jgi:hypothetical protein
MRIPTRAAVPAAILTIFPSFVWGQKLEIQPHDQKEVVRIETALDHLTVIELGDPVVMVAIGNQSAFMVERRENKVLVKPHEEGLSTNLFIWTSTHRYAYELVPAPDIARMHFAIDQQGRPRTVLPPPPVAAPPTPVTAEGPLRKMLSAAVPVPVYGKRENKHRTQVTIRSLFRHGDRIHLQYEITNHSRAAYSLAPPVAWRLTSVQSKQSLVPLGDVQLGENIARSLLVQAVQPAPVLKSEQAPHLAAGRSGVGWIELEFPRESEGPQILQLRFPPDSNGPVNAFLVLNHREVGDAPPIE